MPFDGSGTFLRVMDWTNDATANIKIRADRHDQEDDNFAAGLSNTLTKDGQSQPTANIPMNSKRIVNMANAVNPQDAATLADIAAKTIRYDTAQALTAAQLLQAHTNLADTQSVLFKAAAYTLVLADRNKLLFTQAAAVITLPLAASVGNNWSIDYRADTGILTFGRNGANIEGLAADWAVAEGGRGKIWTDGTNWFIRRDGLSVKVTVFTAASTVFTADPHMVFADVDCWGGGGAGGGHTATTTTNSIGGGGHAGAKASARLTKAQIGTGVTVTVGAGGVGVSGAAGNDGGNTTFGALVSAAGGPGGGTIQAGGGGVFRAQPASAVQSATGDVKGWTCPGDGGACMRDGSGTGFPTYGGIGGSNELGGGGVGALVTTGGGGGNAGKANTGAGGGGAAASNAQSARVGASGGTGLCICVEYILN